MTPLVLFNQQIQRLIFQKNVVNPHIWKAVALNLYANEWSKYLMINQAVIYHSVPTHVWGGRLLADTLFLTTAVDNFCASVSLWMLTHHWNAVMVQDNLCPVQWCSVCLDSRHTHYSYVCFRRRWDNWIPFVHSTHYAESSSTVEYTWVLFCVVWHLFFLFPAHSIFVKWHPPAFSSPNIKCHLA